MKKVSVVLPVFNEEEVIADFHATLVQSLEPLNYRFEIIYVVDKGTDRTLEILRSIAATDERVAVIALSRRFGHQMSLVAGIDHTDADAVIMMDSDLEHPPTVIPKLLAKFEEGYEVVHARRDYPPDASLLKRGTSRLFYRAVGRISDIGLAAGSADFRLISGRVARIFRENIRERNQFLRGLFHWVGFSQAYVDFTSSTRPKGRSKYGMLRLFSFAVSGLTSFSKLPLRLSMFLGLTISLGCFLYALYALVIYLTSSAVPAGWTSLALVISFIGGIELVFLGILGEYIGLIFDEVKGRPLYLIEEIIRGGKR